MFFGERTCSCRKTFKGAWNDLILLIVFSPAFLHTTIRRHLFKCLLLKKYPPKFHHCEEEAQCRLPSIAKKIFSFAGEVEILVTIPSIKVNSSLKLRSTNIQNMILLAVNVSLDLSLL